MAISALQPARFVRHHPNRSALAADAVDGFIRGFALGILAI
jgi:hypothetical protein